MYIQLTGTFFIFKKYYFRHSPFSEDTTPVPYQLKKKMGTVNLCSGTGTVTFRLSGTGTVINYGSGTRTRTVIKWNHKR